MKKVPKLLLFLLIVVLILTGCNKKQKDDPKIDDPIIHPSYTLADSATPLPEGMPGLLDYLTIKEGYFKVYENDLVYLIITLGQESENNIALSLKDIIEENSGVKINLETKPPTEGQEGTSTLSPLIMVLIFEKDFSDLEIILNEDKSLKEIDIVYHFTHAIYEETDETGALILHLNQDEDSYFHVFELTPLQAEILPHLKLQKGTAINIFYVTEENQQPVIVELQIPGK